MNYNLLKLLHIIGIVTWLGPSLGGYYMIIFSFLTHQSEIELWLRQEYLSLVYIEIAGFLVIVLSGLLMLISSKWALLSQLWLRIKGLIVIFIFIPLELIQLYIYNGPLKKAFISGTGIKEAALMFDRFSVFAIIIITLTVPAVMALGIFKPLKK
jgi:uncharacterized membrane protein